jgi:hypothetical protein
MAGSLRGAASAPGNHFREGAVAFTIGHEAIREFNWR